LPGFSAYQVTVRHIGTITVDLTDSSGISWLNYALGETGLEDGLISAVVRLAPQSPTIWDVGANAGFFAAALIQCLNGYTEIHLFEPNPALARRLQELATLLPRVHAHNLALSDATERLTLYVPTRDSSIASFTPVRAASPVNVECTTGDAFLRSTGHRDPDVVIIDTEGNDCRVIKGLTELINRKRPIVFFEHIFETAETIRSAVPQGYRHFTVDDKSGELLAGLDKNRGHNSVFLPQQ
jgi:FkbM family methyltransferase